MPNAKPTVVSCVAGYAGKENPALTEEVIKGHISMNKIVCDVVNGATRNCANYEDYMTLGTVANLPILEATRRADV